MGIFAISIINSLVIFGIENVRLAGDCQFPTRVYSSKKEATFYSSFVQDMVYAFPSFLIHNSGGGVFHCPNFTCAEQYSMRKERLNEGRIVLRELLFCPRRHPDHAFSLAKLQYEHLSNNHDIATPLQREMVSTNVIKKIKKFPFSNLACCLANLIRQRTSAIRGIQNCFRK